jgi:hypothetical protein
MNSKSKKRKPRVTVQSVYVQNKENQVKKYRDLHSREKRYLAYLLSLCHFGHKIIRAVAKGFVD